jgi:aminopeptidase N
LRQAPCKYADQIFRQQRIEIGFYGEDGNFVKAIEKVNIEGKEITDVPELVGVEVPAAILLNNNDWGFGHFTLNESSITVFEKSLSKINSALNRAVIIG